MPVKGSRGDSVNDLQRASVPDQLSGAGEKFCVEGVELVWIGVSPEREPIDAANNLERGVECCHDVRTGESI